MNKVKTILEKPTVGDVIKKLSEYPENMPFRIEDADTNWTIDIVHFDSSNGELFLSGQYEEMKH